MHLFLYGTLPEGLKNSALKLKKLCKDTFAILSQNLTAFEANIATFQKCTHFQNLDHCG